MDVVCIHHGYGSIVSLSKISISLFESNQYIHREDHFTESDDSIQIVVNVLAKRQVPESLMLLGVNEIQLLLTFEPPCDDASHCLAGEPQDNL